MTAELPKQVIVIRTRYPDGKGGYFKPRTGKLIAQGAHASGKVFFDTVSRDALALGFPEGFERVRLSIEVDKAMFLWLAGIFTKVCCRADSEEELLEIYERAKRARLPCCLITDAGKTEFHGIPTHTAVAVGPAMPEEIDPVTGHLKLL